MSLKTLPLDPVVNIIVNLSARAAVRKSFDLALLVGETDVILPEERVRIFSGINEMIEAGFITEDRLYKAATLIFGQNKKPTRVAVGCIDKNVIVPPETEGGTPTAREETPLEAMAACRQANDEWYVGIYCADATKEEHLAIAEYINAVKPSSLYAYTTDEASAPTNGDKNIFAAMKAKNYRRTIGQYSSKHPDAIAAIIGFAMGSMTGTAGSAYTLAYKTEVGVETENAMGVFTSNAVENIKKNNGNVYINRGTYYDIFEEGNMADGTWFDEMIYLDKYSNDMQLAIMDLLYQNQKIAQTEAGMTMIHNALIEVCETARNIGFIESGVWKAKDILSLQYGDTLPNGYLIQSEPIDSQVQADREARKAPPVYVALKLAGAIHHVTVQVDVNR